MTDKKKILIITTIVAVALIIVIATVCIILLVPRKKTEATVGHSLMEVYSKNRTALDAAGLTARIYEDKAEVKEVCRAEDMPIAELVLEFEGGLLVAFQYANAINIDIDSTVRQEGNLVFISPYEDMTDLLYGDIATVSQGVTFKSDISGKVTLLLGADGDSRGVDIIGYRAYANSDINEVNISPTVTKIEQYAFYNATNLTKIDTNNADMLEYIQANAFNNCTSLTALTLKEKTTHIGDYAFLNCQSMTKLDIAGDIEYIGEGALMGTSSLVEVTVGGGLILQDSMLMTSDRTRLIRYLGREKVVVIPDHIDDIGDAAFERNPYIERVSGNVDIIGNYAFESCRNLTVADLFRGGCQKIGKNAFFNTKIAKVELTEALIVIGESAFRATNISSIDIPSSTAEIGSKAFYDCSRLRKIDIKQPPTMGESVFNGTYRIFTADPSRFDEEKYDEYRNYIYRRDSIIGDYATTGVDGGLEIVQYLGESPSVTVPAKLNGKVIVSIGERAFYNLIFIREVVFANGSGVKTLQKSAFEAMSELNKLVLPQGLESIGENTIRNCMKLETLIIPKTVNKIARYAFDQTKWLNNQGEMVIVGDEILYKYKGNSKTVDLPNNLKQIGDRAFYNNSTLETIVMPSSIIRINGFAFGACSSLKKISLNEGLLEIAESVFGGCIAMRTITIPSTVWYIGYGTFYKNHLISIKLLMTKPINIGGDMFSYPQNMDGFIIFAPKAAVCDSFSGVCNHAEGKTACFRHANMWIAWRRIVEGGDW